MGLVCVIIGLRAEDFPKNRFTCFSPSKHEPTSALNGTFWGENARIFYKEKQLVRFSTIFNFQTVYYSYVKKKNEIFVPCTL